MFENGANNSPITPTEDVTKIEAPTTQEQVTPSAEQTENIIQGQVSENEQAQQEQAEANQTYEQTEDLSREEAAQVLEQLQQQRAETPAEATAAPAGVTPTTNPGAATAAPGANQAGGQ